ARGGIVAGELAGWWSYVWGGGRGPPRLRTCGSSGVGLAVGGADIGRRIDHPRLVGEARGVGGGIDEAPGGGVAGGDVRPGQAAGAAELPPLVPSLRPLGARHRQRDDAVGEPALRPDV